MKFFGFHLLTFLLLFNFFASAQVADDFADGNFTENPAWTGEEALFIVNDSKQLQLNDTTERTAYLSTVNTIGTNAEWHFWVKLSFSPSSNNNARIYLVSNSEDIAQSLNGYFLQLGETGSNDAIELFRQTGTTMASVCRGTEGLIANSFTLGLKITRNNDGLWTILADPDGGVNYQLQAQGIDNTFTQTSYIGFYCKYTKSNSTKFYFDEVYAGPIIVDEEPPVILSLESLSDSSLVIHFSEPMDDQSAENISNYLVNQGIGYPEVALLSNPAQVELDFSDHFINGTNYLISVSGVKDLAGNMMQPQEKAFSFYTPNTFDIVINEIMADPNPVVGLPDFEYLELFNRTNQLISLNNWVLTIGSSEKLFDNISIEPNGFLIVASEDARFLLASYGDFYGFSSFALTNSGQSLVLKDKNGNLISTITYADTWYNDPAKAEGGWSLEQVNPENVCSGADNWTASVSGNGGTPGAVNAVISDVVFLPEINRVEVAADTIIRLFFNQSMDPISITSLDFYTVDQSIGNPTSTHIFEEQNNLVELYFASKFETGIVYILTVSQSVSNCIGNEMKNDSIISFGISEIPVSNDIVINEILFNPWTNGVDYVEIYNRSAKVIDISSLKIGKVSATPPNPPDTVYYTISTEQTLLVPSAYSLLTSSPTAVQEQYYTSNPYGFLRVDPFPAYNNDKGTCLLADNSGLIIDAFDYNEDMHYPLLLYLDGVALERTNFESPANDRANWHSAAQSVGFGTPAFINSQFVPEGNSNDQISIQPEIFSPDNDGFNDIISIQYNFNQPGNMITITVFNSAGQLIRRLVNNEYAGTTGSFNWNGIADNNTLAPVGIYVFFIQVFDVDGNVNHFKRVGVLAAKL